MIRGWWEKRNTIQISVQHKKDEVIFKFIVNKQVFDGAPARIRTADLLITNQLLYQLSYKGI